MNKRFRTMILAFMVLGYFVIKQAEGKLMFNKIDKMQQYVYYIKHKRRQKWVKNQW